MKLKTALLSLPLACVLLVTANAQEMADKTEAGSDKKMQAAAQTQESEKPLAFNVADGNLMFEATGDWKSVKPKSRMLEFEIEVPKTEDDESNGRLTIMGAGGSIDANVKRWEGQFGQPDGSATEAKTKEFTVNDMDVTMVDISGTFTQTMGGPFSGGKKVESPDQRMLAAIIQTPESGNYFVKLVGPAATIKANEAEFENMIKGAKLKSAE